MTQVSFSRSAVEGKVDAINEEKNRPCHLQERRGWLGRNGLGPTEHDPALSPV